MFNNILYHSKHCLTFSRMITLHFSIDPVAFNLEAFLISRNKLITLIKNITQSIYPYYISKLLSSKISDFKFGIDLKLN
jgi:hypothetical protein